MLNVLNDQQVIGESILFDDIHFITKAVYYLTRRVFTIYSSGSCIYQFIKILFFRTTFFGNRERRNYLIVVNIVKLNLIKYLHRV